MAFAVRADYFDNIVHQQNVNAELQWMILQCNDSKGTQLRIMNIYAPHRGKSTEDYLAFLQEVSIARADMEAQFPDGITIIMGDYNAELGKGKEPSLDRNNETVWGNDHGGRIGGRTTTRPTTEQLLVCPLNMDHPYWNIVVFMILL